MKNENYGETEQVREKKIHTGMYRCILLPSIRKHVHSLFVKT